MKTDLDVLRAMVTVTDGLALLAALTLFVCLSSADKRSRSVRFAIAAVGALVLWGAAWSFVPLLSALRLGPSTNGAPSAVPTLALIVGTSSALSLLALLPAAQRAFFATVDRRAVLALGSWRTVFGTGLFMFGLAGGLPSGFFWSAAIGDIVVGVTSTLLLAQGQQISDRSWLAWNALGLADLLHVVTFAALYVGPFFVANPSLPALNLVPLVIVTSFIALHVGALRQGYASSPTPQAVNA